jgi:hypothetical protein
MGKIILITCHSLGLKGRSPKFLLVMLGDKITIVIFSEQIKQLHLLRISNRIGKLHLRVLTLSKFSRISRCLLQAMLLSQIPLNTDNN